MTMLPVCSATSSCYSHPQISFPGSWRHCSLFCKDFISRCNVEDNFVLGMSNGSHLHKVSVQTQANKSLYSNVVGNTEESSSENLFNFNYEVSDISDSIGATSDSSPVRSGELIFVENSPLSPMEEGLKDFAEPLTENINSTVMSVEPATVSTIDISPKNSVLVPESLDLDKESFLNVKSSFDDFDSRVKKSFSSSLNNGEHTIKNTLDVISSSIKSIAKNASEVVDDTVSRAFSTVNQTGNSAGNKVSRFSSNLKETSSKATVVAIDLLRQTISTVENSVASGVSFLVYSYGSAKELLPPDILNAINLSEDAAIKVLMPVRIALEQVYIAVEGLERSIGLDPNDPIVHLVLIVGTSGTIWVFYWLWAYSGYAGDLSPKSALDFLKSKEKCVLIDVRPEALREKEGIPDLRRAARFRYASVTLPEVDGAERKMLKSGREVDDILMAVVIKNLKAVQDRSKVIVMDADGTRSKGIARALRKVGIKRPYLVQGGFNSWTKEGLRVKELKPETTFTILNEEAEAILEDINPSPLQVVGVGMGFVAALFALLEWEKSLQLIGVFGLSLTIYRRVASYEGADDFRQDVRLLLAPLRLGTQAFSWAAGKLETNRIGIPTSPSSSDVQSRVLQAAAKHESQPSDAEGIQDPSSEVTAPVNNNVDLSEA